MEADSATQTLTGNGESSVRVLEGRLVCIIALCAMMAVRAWAQDSGDVPPIANPFDSLPIAQSSASSGSNVVATTSGTLHGSPPDANGIISFKGIPFVQAPVGLYRWRAPQPAPARPDIQDATAFGPACLSTIGPDPSRAGTATIPQSEDCLTINVWTPTTIRNARKPVMVWIHGGGFQFGSSAISTYDGSLLATHDVVVVSFNYRLGVFGFLATSGLDDESGTSGCGDCWIR